MRPSPSLSLLAALAGLAAGTLPPGVGAQEEGREAGAPGSPGSCPDGRISVVFVDNHSVFDTSDPELEGRFLWAFKLANKLHWDTSQGFIRREVLFGPGDCYDPLLLEESERILREHRFIAGADVFTLRQPDGTHHVIVDTQDEWTTELDLGLTLDEGLQVETIEITEESFLGRGMLLELSFRERRERRDFGLSFATPQLFGSRWDAELGAGRTRVGDFWREGVFYPFLGEVGRMAARHRMESRESLFAWVVDDGGEFTHVTVPVDEELFETTVAARFGQPGHFTVVGAGISRESRVFPGGTGGVEAVPNAEFDQAVAATDSQAGALGAQITPRAATRINLILGLRNLRFVQRRGLDALRGVRDVAVGTRTSVTVGKSLTLLGESEVDPTDDLFTRFDLYAGTAPEPWVLAGNLQLEGRRVFAEEVTGDGWRDVLVQADALAYWKPPSLSPRHTFFARAAFSGGWEMVTPFQLTLGGREGVRGLGEDDLPGGRRLLLSVEDRLSFDWPAPTFFDMGATLFLDGGTMWRGETPFGTSSGFQAAAGLGLRIGFPAGSRSVIRADLAFPLTGAGQGGGPVFRVVMNELLGLSGGFGGLQMTRSRRASIDTEFRGVSR